MKYYYVNPNINISSEQLSRLSNYLNGEFYSYQLDRRVDGYPIAFLITEDGKKSIILACHGKSNDCNTSIEIFQLIKGYEKKENQKIKILALEKKILIKENKILRKNKIIKLNKSKNIFKDYILLPSDKCSSDDC